MKTPLDTEVDVRPGHIVLDRVPALSERGTAASIFSARVCCGPGRPSQLLLTTERLYYTIIRPHRSTAYVDAAYSCRQSSVVCVSVGLSVTLVSPAKTAAPIELLFGLRTWVGPGNHVLDGGPDPPMGRGKFLERMGVPL